MKLIERKKNETHIGHILMLFLRVHIYLPPNSEEEKKSTNTSIVRVFKKYKNCIFGCDMVAVVTLYIIFSNTKKK